MNLAGRIVKWPFEANPQISAPVNANNRHISMKSVVDSLAILKINWFLKRNCAQNGIGNIQETIETIHFISAQFDLIRFDLYSNNESKEKSPSDMFFDRASRAQQRTPLNEHIHFSRMLLRPIKLFVYTLDE